MNVKKQAAKDAYEYALADLFFGEGAGTRRKLISTKVSWNSEHIPGYKAALDKALAQVNFAQISEQAVKERKKIDRLHSASKNLKALGRGDLRGASTAVVVLATVAVVAHEAGFDRVAVVEAKKAHRKAKAKYAAFKLKRGF